MPTKIRSYLSPTLVLLAFDWPEGANHQNFLGFAILRTPGHKGLAADYLFNKLSFGATGGPFPSNEAPIQKFLWWDSGITSDDRGKQLTYTVTPVIGSGPGDLHLQTVEAGKISVTIPHEEQDGIGTYFNRAVVSSQAFKREFSHPQASLPKAMRWLANGLDAAIPNFLLGDGPVTGAIYHLTDKTWVIPAMKAHTGNQKIAYHLKPPDVVSSFAAKALASSTRQFFKRTKTNIMHDKFLVRYRNGKPAAVLMGSANFTPEALTTQANLLHTFESERLAALYTSRAELLAKDPAKKETAKQDSDWSEPIQVGKARVRVFFSPEPKGQRKSIDAVVRAVKSATRSVLFCLYSPTDQALLDAMFEAGDQGKLLFGLLNSISDPNKKGKKASDPEKALAKPRKTSRIVVEVYNRSRKDKKVVAYDYFRPGKTPADFLPELSTLDTSSQSIVPPQPVSKASKGKKKKGPPPAVHIHHKFIVIDAETGNPVIYTGSANMSKNSTENNDENLLEIKGDLELAQLYFAEFLRLYNHYRARALWDWIHAQKTKGGAKGDTESLVLKLTRDGWAKRAFTGGTSEWNSRVSLANEPN
jgi:phosphatidylserine/phosphatidylglycerophosphate/cardiolipin synthase-like enzyme